MRSIQELTQGQGCFASAGRGFGHTMRSVEGYVSEVINRGVCIVDNTLEEGDDEYRVRNGRVERTVHEGTCDATENLLSQDPDDENQVRHRSHAAHVTGGSEDLAAAEVWDVKENGSNRFSYGSLGCAPLVDVDSDQDDYYRISANSASPASELESNRAGAEARRLSDQQNIDLSWTKESDTMATLDISN